MIYVYELVIFSHSKFAGHLVFLNLGMPLKRNVYGAVIWNVLDRSCQLSQKRQCFVSSNDPLWIFPDP